MTSGGEFPVSLAVHVNLLYVLNGAADSLTGYRITVKRLVPITKSTRALGLTPSTGSMAFLNTPDAMARSSTSHPSQTLSRRCVGSSRGLGEPTSSRILAAAPSATSTSIDAGTRRLSTRPVTVQARSI